MQAFPHLYTVNAVAGDRGDVILDGEGLPVLRSASPPEFDGPGGRWSPESLLVASVADCLILTFRALARAARFEYSRIHCQATGTLDRVDRVTRFTAIALNARLEIPGGASSDEARRLLLKAEEHCLISNSLSAVTTLDVEIVAMPEAVGA